MKEVTEFIAGYFKGLGEAVVRDYNVFGLAIFAILASAAWGVFRGLAYATGLYAILRFLSDAVGGIINAVHNLAGAVASAPREDPNA